MNVAVSLRTSLPGSGSHTGCVVLILFSHVNVLFSATLCAMLARLASRSTQYVVMPVASHHMGLGKGAQQRVCMTTKSAGLGFSCCLRTAQSCSLQAAAAQHAEKLQGSVAIEHELSHLLRPALSVVLLVTLKATPAVPININHSFHSPATLSSQKSG